MGKGRVMRKRKITRVMDGGREGGRKAEGGRERVL